MNDEQKLDALGTKFLTALEHHRSQQLDSAEDVLREILREEPRLAEPQLTLGRILLDTNRLADAEEHTRQALEILDSDGQWTDEIPTNVLQALAHAQLAEVLRQAADEDDVIFGEPDRYHAMLTESQTHFAKASELDPSDATSSYFAFFLGPPSSDQAN